jgi:DNA topoisomerase-1
LKVGRFGAFIGCSRYPECRFTRQLAAGENGAGAGGGTRVLGTDPETGLEVSVRSGRFGPYLQLGEQVAKGEKPKRASLPKGTSPDDVELEQALGLLSLPRTVGTHPEDGEPILAGVGRFGPYVQHGKIYANLEDGDDVLNIGLNRAVTLIAEKKLKPSKGRRFGPPPGRELGEHPDRGGPVVAKAGRYGPYVTHDGINATITGDKTADTVTLEEAVALIDARVASGAVGKRKPKTAKVPKQSKAEKEPKAAKAPKTAKKTKAAKTPKATEEPKAAPLRKIAASKKADAGTIAVEPAAKKASAKKKAKAEAAEDKTEEKADS